MISSSLPLRLLARSLTAVRLTCISYTRPAASGIWALRGWLSSITSPLLISLAALRTVCGFMWLAAPRSSPAPHLDGQRALSAGGSQEGVWATAAPVSSRVASMVLSVKGFMVVLPDFGLRLNLIDVGFRLSCRRWHSDFIVCNGGRPPRTIVTRLALSITWAMWADSPGPGQTIPTLLDFCSLFVLNAPNGAATHVRRSPPFQSRSDQVARRVPAAHR